MTDRIFEELLERILKAQPKRIATMYKKEEEFLLRMARPEREDPPSEEEIITLLKSIGRCLVGARSGRHRQLMNTYLTWENRFISLYNKPCPLNMKEVTGVRIHPKSP